MANIMAPELPDKIKLLPQPFKNIVSYCLVKNARERAQKAEELMVLLNSKEPEDSFRVPGKIEEKQISPEIKWQPEKTEERSITAPLYPLNEKKDIPAEQKTSTQPQKESFSFEASVEEKSIKKPGKGFRYTRISVIGGGILLLLLYFLFIKKYANENSISVNAGIKDTTITQKNPSTGDTTFKKSSITIPATDSQSSHQTNITTDKTGKATNEDIASGKGNEASPTEGKRLKQKRGSLEKNNNAKKMPLEITTKESCKIFWNGKSYADLASGTALTTHIDAGVYTLKAVSAETNKVYVKIITVRSSDIRPGARININILFR